MIVLLVTFLQGLKGIADSLLEDPFVQDGIAKLEETPKNLLRSESRNSVLGLLNQSLVMSCVSSIAPGF